MREVALTRDLLNSNKILFHYGRMLEEIARGRTDFNPVAVEIHPTAVCNHRCVHCSYKERNESRASLPREVMDRLVESVVRMRIRAVYFSGGGEPTLYPGLAGYIEKLTENGVECSVLTNGSCFAEAGLIPVANRLNYIAVSVPGVDQETFKAVTGTGNLEKVLALPNQIKAVHGENSPIVGARIVLTNKNYRQVDAFLRTMRERNYDYALFKVVRDYEDNGQGLSQEEESYLREEVRAHGDLDDRFTNIRSIFGYKTLPEFKNACWINRYGMLANVSTDGKVYPNIVEIDRPEFCIGDLHRETLEEMWNGPRHKEVKKRSDERWIAGACRNCRAMAYNAIVNDWMDRLPAHYDPFI